MTNFERIGVERQDEARNFWQAHKQFENSCKLCCYRGMRIECDRCHINHAHEAVKKYKFPQQAKMFEERNKG